MVLIAIGDLLPATVTQVWAKGIFCYSMPCCKEMLSQNLEHEAVYWQEPAEHLRLKATICFHIENANSIFLEWCSDEGIVGCVTTNKKNSENYERVVQIYLHVGKTAMCDHTPYLSTHKLIARWSALMLSYFLDKYQMQRDPSSANFDPVI